MLLPHAHLPELSDAEAFALCDALGGLLDEPHTANYLAANIQEAEKFEALGAKWKIDGLALSLRMLKLTRPELEGVIELVRRFWSYSNDRPDCDNRVLLLRVRDELARTAHQRLEAATKLARLTGDSSASAEKHGGEDRLAGLSRKGDDLERRRAVVDFEVFRPELERAVPRADRSRADGRRSTTS